MQKLVFESYTLAYADDNVQNPCYEKKPLGFAAQLMSLNGYDPMSLLPRGEDYSRGYGKTKWSGHTVRVRILF